MFLTFVVFERFEHGVFGGVGTDGVPEPVAGNHDEVLYNKYSAFILLII